LISKNPLTRKLIENVDLLVSNLNTKPNELLISTVNELQISILGRH